MDVTAEAEKIMRESGLLPDEVFPVGRTKGRLGLYDRLLTAADLDQLPPVEWLVGPMIPQGALVCVYGKPGSYKSFLALDWALSVATGTNWCGWHCKQGRALYLAAEGIAGTPQRVRAWQEDRGVSELPDAYWLPVTVNLRDSEQGPELVELAQQVEPAVVIIDTLARCLVGGDENSATDMGMAVHVATQIIATTGATVVVVHHTDKAGANYRGSSALEGASDTMIEIVSEGGGAVKISVTKQKDAAAIEPLTILAVETSDSVVMKAGARTGPSLSRDEVSRQPVSRFWC